MLLALHQNMLLAGDYVPPEPEQIALPRERTTFIAKFPRTVIC